jgi:hypothetical protein
VVGAAPEVVGAGWRFGWGGGLWGADSGWAWGEAEVGREVDAEEVGEGAQGAGEGFQGFGRGGGEEGLGFRRVEEGFELGGVGGGAVAEFLHDPGAALGELDGGRAALGGGAGAAGAELAFGEAGKEAGETLAGAGDAAVERDVEGGEGGGVVVEEGEEGGEDGGQAGGEVAGGGEAESGCLPGLGVGGGCLYVHDMFYTVAGGWVQGAFPDQVRRSAICPGSQRRLSSIRPRAASGPSMT